MLNIYLGLINIHVGLRRYVAFHYIPYSGAEYIVVSRLNQYQKYVFQSHSKLLVTDATLTVGSRHFAR
jgi:hypothetical protein